MTIIVAIGMAFALPAIPTSGAMIPPEIIEKNPMSADALPAFLPCARIAREKLAAPMIDTIGITTSSDRITNGNTAWNQKAAKISRLPAKA